MLTPSEQASIRALLSKWERLHEEASKGPLAIEEGVIRRLLEERRNG